MGVWVSPNIASETKAAISIASGTEIGPGTGSADGLGFRFLSVGFGVWFDGEG